MSNWDFELEQPEPTEPYASVATALEADGEHQLATVARAWPFFSDERRAGLRDRPGLNVRPGDASFAAVAAVLVLQRSGDQQAHDLAWVVESFGSRYVWECAQIVHGAVDTLRQEAVAAEYRRLHPPHRARRKV
ncbi:MAG: hypothetical protein AAFU73_03355 [Planctomycetota bacterium]